MCLSFGVFFNIASSETYVRRTNNSFWNVRTEYNERNIYILVVLKPTYVYDERILLYYWL